MRDQLDKKIKILLIYILSSSLNILILGDENDKMHLLCQTKNPLKFDILTDHIHNTFMYLMFKCKQTSDSISILSLQTYIFP